MATPKSAHTHSHGGKTVAFQTTRIWEWDWVVHSAYTALARVPMPTPYLPFEHICVISEPHGDTIRRVLRHFLSRGGRRGGAVCGQVHMHTHGGLGRARMTHTHTHTCALSHVRCGARCACVVTWYHSAVSGGAPRRRCWGQVWKPWGAIGRVRR